MSDRRPPALPLATLRAAVRHPSLWPAMLRMVPPRWWAAWPPVPRPARDYTAFRYETMFGDSDQELDADAFVAYLKWCRSMGSRSR